MEDLTIKYPWNRQTGLHNLFGITNRKKRKEKKRKEKKRKEKKRKEERREKREERREEKRREGKEKYIGNISNVISSYL